MLHPLLPLVLMVAFSRVSLADAARPLHAESPAMIYAAENSESSRGWPVLPSWGPHDKVLEARKRHLSTAARIHLNLRGEEVALSSDYEGSDSRLDHLSRLDAGNLREILGRELSPSAVDEESGWSDLHWAAALNLPEMAEVLLDMGAEVDARLHSSYPDSGWSGRIQERLLETLGFNLKLHGQTPLHIAAETNALDVVNVLVEHGADIHAGHWNDDGGWIPLEFAVNANALSVATMLVDRSGAGIDKSHLNSLLGHAAYRNAAEVVAMLIDRGAEIDAMTDFGRRPLHSAAYGNAPEVVAALLARGADINAKDVSGWTPLHFASCGHHAPSSQAAMMLIARGADVNAKSNIDQTPLHLTAACYGRGIAEVLIEQGARLHARDNDGQTPLHAAAWSNARMVASVLIQRGADIDAKDDDERTPLALAQERNHHDMAALLKH